MKVNVTATGIASASFVAKSVAERRSSLGLFAQVRLSAQGDTLEVFASDGDHFYTHRILAGVEEEGEVSVNVFPLAHISSQLMEPVTFVGTERGLEMTTASGRSRYVFPVANTEGEVQVPEVEGEIIEIPSGELVNAIKSVSYAIAKDRNIPAIFHGLCFRSRGGKLYLIASDKRQLAEVCVAEGVEVDIDFVVSAKVFQILSSLSLSDKSLPIAIKVGKSVVEFSYRDTWTLVARVIEGKFPDHFALLPEEYAIKVKVSKQELSRSLKRVIATLPQGVVYPATINIDPAEPRLRVEVKEDDAEVHDEVSVEEIEGEETSSVRCSPKFLLSATTLIKEDTLHLLVPVAKNPSLVLLAGERERAMVATQSI